MHQKKNRVCDDCYDEDGVGVGSVCGRQRRRRRRRGRQRQNKYDENDTTSLFFVLLDK